MSRDAGRRVRLAGLAATALLAVCAPVAAGSIAAPATADAPRAELAPAGRVAVPGGTVIARYQQRAGGLPVLDAEAVVVDMPGEAPVLVTDTTEPDLDAEPAGERLSRTQAIAAAREATGAGALRARPQTRLGIDPRTGIAVWEVILPTAKPLADRLAVLDARDGELLRSRDLLQEATGSAMIFNPNPVVQQGNSYSGLRDRNDRDSALLNSLRVPVELPRITSAKGCLVGTYADARIGKRAKPVCRASLDFTDLTRSKGSFEAVMAYFHIDRTRAYIDGLGLSQPLRSKPQRLRVNGITDDNSFYSPATRSITLGSGGVDDAEDADVVIHEYGHSLQDQAVAGFGRSVDAGSMGEGFGDYLSAAMSALSTGGDVEASVCIFDWDGISYSASGCGRRADTQMSIEQAERRCSFQIHCTGEVWASSLFELRQALGNDAGGIPIMDRVVLESHFMLSPRAKFRDAARALIAADQALYGGVHTDVIEAEMVQRKYCPASGC